MRTFIGAMVILFVIIIGAGIYMHWLNSTVQHLDANLDALITSVETSDWHSTYTGINQFLSNWDHIYPKLELFIHHNEIDKINTLLYEIKGYAHVKKREEFLVKAGVLQVLIRQLPIGEQITGENIL
ncbi:MAG: DUF4363 family protein [Ruminococcaceae bacterium]|nr:DUF4363 family protein [Oscillospiraceae bacterium]